MSIASLSERATPTTDLASKSTWIHHLFHPKKPLRESKGSQRDGKLITRHEELSTPNLHKLPTELLLMISHYLPPSSAACLAFTHPTIYSVFDHALFQRLKAKNLTEFKALLELLARDYEYLINCDACISLHDTRIPIPSIESKLNTGKYVDMRKFDVVGNVPLTEVLMQLRAPRRKHSGQRKVTVFKLLNAHIQLSLLRCHREPGEQHGLGVCVKELNAAGTHVVKFPPEKSKGMKDGHTAGGPFKATYYWSAESRVIDGDFLHLQACRIELSTDFMGSGYNDGTSFINLRRALACIDLRCCPHCKQNNTVAEVICKLNQWSLGTVNCVSAHKQPDYVCGEHIHWNCNCTVDFEVQKVGRNEIEVKTWRLMGLGPVSTGGWVKVKRGMAKQVWEGTSSGWRAAAVRRY
jgi:hypothetical protein